MTTDMTTNEPADLALPYLPDDGEGVVSFAPPRMDWLHGNKAAKTPGVFYIKADELGEAPGEPWASDDRFMSGENPELGFSTTRLRVLFLAYRSQWFVPPARNSNERTRWLAGYEDGAGARKLVEYLVLAEGLADPVVLGLSKISKSTPIKELLAVYRSSVLRQAARQLKRTSVPQYLFWIPIGGKLDDKGKPVYSTVESKTTGDSSFVTYPVAHWPADLSEARADNATLRRIYEEILPQYRGWSNARRNNGDYVEAEAYAVDDDVPALPPASGTSRNVPQPIESDQDLPF